MYKRQVRYLSGAGALLGEVRRLAAETLNWEKIEHYVQRLAVRELPDLGKPGSEALRLLSAAVSYTHLSGAFSRTLAAVSAYTSRAASLTP